MNEKKNVFRLVNRCVYVNDRKGEVNKRQERKYDILRFDVLLCHLVVYLVS